MLWEDKWHLIFSWNQQHVSEIAHFWKTVASNLISWSKDGKEHFIEGSLITSFPMDNRKWVTLFTSINRSHHILHYMLTTGSKCYCIFYMQFHYIILFSIDCEWTFHNSPAKSNLTMSSPLINSLWVVLPFFWKTILSHVQLWPIGSEQHCC